MRELTYAEALREPLHQVMQEDAGSVKPICCKLEEEAGKQ